jgi:hypothetical protein
MGWDHSAFLDHDKVVGLYITGIGMPMGCFGCRYTSSIAGTGARKDVMASMDSPSQVAPVLMAEPTVSRAPTQLRWAA